MEMVHIEPGSFVAGEFADLVRQQVEDRGAQVPRSTEPNGTWGPCPGLTSPGAAARPVLQDLNEITWPR